MSLNGGDVLARGGKSAQFAVGGSKDEPVELRNKVVADELPETLGVSVVDKRRHYNPLGEVEEVKAVPQVSTKKFKVVQPILDRVLIKRINDNPDEKVLDDGSVINVKTGLVVAAKYRQHSNVGIVLAIGQFVCIGGVRVPLSTVLRPGDKVTFGDYNSEIFPMDEEKEKRLCESLGLNFVPEEGSIRLVRVQDIRGVEEVENE